MLARRHRFTPLALLVVACLALLPTPARAQVEAVEPRWVIVDPEPTLLRCGDFERFYAVAEVQPGTALRLDGEGGGWARVIYPDKVYALLSARDAELVNPGTARLTRPSKLRASNMNPEVGVAGSWRSVYRTPLAEGTELRVVETIRDQDGSIDGFRVVPPAPPAAPHPPHAYLPLEKVRNATLEELGALEDRDTGDQPATQKPEAQPTGNPTQPAGQPANQEATRPADQPETQPQQPGDAAAETDTPAEQPTETPVQPQTRPTTPAADQPTRQPAQQPGQQPTGQPSEQPAGQPSGEGESMIEPVIIPTPGEPPVVVPDPGAMTDESEAQAPEAETDAPAGQPAPGAPAEPEAEEPAGPLTIDDLEAEFVRVRTLGRQALDDSLDELIREYERTLVTLDEPLLQRIAENRLEWLRIRQTTRDERREIDATLREADAQTQAVRRQIQQLEQSQRYAVVGRLVPSALYSGDRLPLLYRIESVGGPAAPRTLGYIRPDTQDQELRGKLGQLVGVVGDVRLDRGLNLMLVRPVRVDLLSPEGE